MKTALMVTLLALSIGASASVPKKASAVKAASAPAATAPAAAASKKSKLSKDIRFNGSQVDGKYLSAGESVAEVEGDKEMGALVGVRKNFHDRLNSETARLQAAQSGKGN